MQTRVYSISELRRIIKESSDEFKPLVYNDDNKKINDKAYKDMANDVKDYDGGARKTSKKTQYPKTDNRGMENLEYNNMNDKFKKDQQSRLKGYVNKQAEDAHKNDDFGNAEFNEIEGIKDNAKEAKKGRDVAKEIGLTSRELDKKDFEKQRETIFGENKLMRLTFKNTKFLTENHMLSRVPDHFKVEGKKFYMKDMANNEYLVEWHVEDDPIVTNKTKINEQKNRVMELFNYKRGESNTTNVGRLAEETKINDMLNKARKLMS